MAQFAYTAKRGPNETLEGSIEADSQDAAVQRLVEQGLFPIRIAARLSPGKPVPVASAPQPRARAVLAFGKRITSKEILVFTQKLTTLIRAQVDLLAAIRILQEQADEGRFKDMLLEVYQAVKEGKTFSESLARFPDVFSPLFVNIVRAGEASGKLDAALDQLTQSLGREEALKTKVRSALAYPVLLLLVGVGSIAVLINFVVPKLESLFLDLGGQLPLMTRFILTLSHVSRRSSLWLLLLGGGAVGFFVWRQGGAALAQLAGRCIRRLPVVKRVADNQEMLHFASSLNLLLRSGVPALKSLQLVTPSLGDPRLRERMSLVCERVALGDSLSQSLQTQAAFSPFVVKMIAVGEESGKLDEVLEEIARSYLQQIEADIALISSLIEPVLILGMGSVLGTIVLSILLPIFEITQSVR